MIMRGTADLRARQLASLGCSGGGGFLLGLSHLFAVSNQRSEARVAMERREIGILFHFQRVAWSESVIYGLAEQGNRLDSSQDP